MMEEMDYRDFFRKFLNVTIQDMDEFIADIKEGKLSLEEIARDLEDLNHLFKFTNLRCENVMNKVSIKFEE